MAPGIVSYYRIKRRGDRNYVYEVESERRPDGTIVQKVVRYLGPVHPIYGGKGPVDIAELRRQRANRRRG